MKKIILIILFSPVVLFSAILISKITNEIKDAKRIEEIERLNTLSKKYLKIDVDSALYYAGKSIQLTKQIENDTLVAKTANLISKAYMQKKEYQLAKKYMLISMNLYRKNKISKKYMLSLIELGIISYSLSEYNNALYYYKQLLKDGNLNKNKEWYALAQHGLGTTYFLMGEYKQAKDYLDSSLTKFNKIKKVYVLPSLFYGIGSVYMATGHYDQALDYLLKSIKKSEDTKQLDYLAMSNHAIGVIFEKLNNYSKAILYDNIALNIAENIDDSYLIGNFLNHTGEIFLSLSQEDSALSYANKSLIVQEEILNKVGISRALMLEGNVYLKKNQYQKALEIFKKAKRILDKVDHKYRKIKIAINLGVVYTKLGNFDNAYFYLHKSLAEAKKFEIQDLVRESLMALSDYYANVNNYKKAYAYLGEYITLNDSIFTTSSQHIAEMQMRYETGKREKENELLKHKIDIQNLEIEKSSLQNWISYLSLAIVSIIGIFSYNRYKAKKKTNVVLQQKIQDAIKKHQKQQEIIFHQANLSSLGELAAGMAHEINQPLQAIKLSTEFLELEMKESNFDKTLMNDNISEIYQSVDRARNIIDHVRIFAGQQKNAVKEYFNPKTVVENALALTGKQYQKKNIYMILKLNKRVGKINGNPYKYEQIVFNLLSNAKDALLDKEVKLNQLYKKEIEVKLFREENDIVLYIKDNGIGMTKDQQDKIFSPFYTTKNLGEGTGLGLSIIFGLVKEMNGRIMVKSTNQSGTSVQVRIPKAIANKTDKDTKLHVLKLN